MNILFVCSRNKWRSRTAEVIFKDSLNHSVKSAGTSKAAKVKLSEPLLVWADIVFVMEEKHQQIVRNKFSRNTFCEKIIVLEIADNYKFMDEELVFILKDSVSAILKDL
jgi:predicted protein tyrosine phosphatase